MSAPELGFDLSINLGNVLTIVGAVGAIVWKASSFEHRLEAADQLRLEEDKARTKEIAEIKTAINEMKSVVTIVAVQKNEIDNLRAQQAEDRRATNERMVRLESRAHE